MRASPINRRASIAEVRAEVQKGYQHAHQLYFDRLFPQASSDLKKKALGPYEHLFHTELFLKPSLAFLHREKLFLITDEARFNSLNPEQQSGFEPVMVLESRSRRARFWVSPEGQIVEFKGLTPHKFNPLNLNHNSGQPNGLLELNPAYCEKAGLDIIGQIDSGVYELGEYFADLGPYAQLFRRAGPQTKYLPWLRMDLSPTLMQILAQLENLPFETFLYQSCARFGAQLRRFHDAGKTLHSPFQEPGGFPEPFFSSLHSGNVEIHGNIIDLEGMVDFAEAERSYKESLARQDRSRLDPRGYIGEKILAEAETTDDFGFFCRLSDLHRLIRGNSHQLIRESSLAGNLFASDAHSPYNFILALTGVIRGYYHRPAKEKNKMGEIDAYLNEKVVPFLQDLHTQARQENMLQRFLFPLPQVYNILSHIEKEILG